MKWVIEARLIDDLSESPAVHLATIDRELTTDTLGLSLAEGKAFLAAAQEYFVQAQCQGIADAHAHCQKCETRLISKGHHDRQIRTLFGRVTMHSPRFRQCRCLGKKPGCFIQPARRRGTGWHDSRTRVPAGQLGRTPVLRLCSFSVERGSTDLRRHLRKQRQAPGAPGGGCAGRFARGARRRRGRPRFEAQRLERSGGGLRLAGALRAASPPRPARQPRGWAGLL